MAFLGAGLAPAWGLTFFGVAQIVTGWWYRLPMPVQPLKAIAVQVLQGRASLAAAWWAAGVLGGGMLVLAWTGVLRALEQRVPEILVRAIQAALGAVLLRAAVRMLALEGAVGWAFLLFGAAVMLWIRLPPGLLLVPAAWLLVGLGFGRPLEIATPKVPPEAAITVLQLALAQGVLSLMNSLLATARTLRDLFPERAPDIARIGTSYGLLNLTAFLLRGIPSCHGAGGVVGHYAFGGRRGYSVMLYGLLYLLLAIWFAWEGPAALRWFPLFLLGTLLVREGFGLILIAGRAIRCARDAVTLGVTVVGTLVSDWQFAGGLLAGGLAYLLTRRWKNGFPRRERHDG